MLIKFQRHTHTNASLIFLIKFSQFKISGKIGKNIPWQNFHVTYVRYLRPNISACYIVYNDIGSMLNCTNLLSCIFTQECKVCYDAS